MRRKVYKNAIGFLLMSWPSPPGDRACPGVCLINPARLPWRKVIFPLAGRYPLPTASWLGREPMSACPSQSWDPVWLEPVQALCTICEVCMHVSPAVSGRHSFLGFMHPLWPLQTIMFNSQQGFLPF